MRLALIAVIPGVVAWAMCSEFGRPSIPPEQLLRALLLQVLSTVRSERLLIEQIEYNSARAFSIFM
jgi:transposase